MNKKLLIFLIIAALGGGGYYYWRKNFSSSFLTQEKIEIMGEKYDVLSREKIDEFGLDLRVIPNKNNAAILYVEASNAYEKLEDLPDIVMHVVMNRWIDNPEVRNWHRNAGECLQILQKAVKKEDCQFPYMGDEETEDVSGFLLPHLKVMRAFARLLSIEGKRLEHSEDFSGALDSYLAIGKMCEHLQRSDSFLLSHIVSVAMFAIMDEAVEKLIANYDISEKDLKRIIKEYERLLKHQPNLKACLKTEKLIGEEILGIAISIPQIKNAHEKAYNIAEKWLEMPTWEALKSENSYEAQIEQLDEIGEMIKKALTAFDRARLQFAFNEGRNRGIIIFAAIKLYEKEEEHPPRNLKELETEGYLSELPKDPFSGKDYIYKVKPEGWIFYSVWKNLVDDGGAGKMPHIIKSEGGDKDLVFWSRRIPHKEPPE